MWGWGPQREPWKEQGGEGRSGPAWNGFVGPEDKTNIRFSCAYREALLAEMGVAVREDGGTVGVFSPKKVSEGPNEEAWETLGAERRWLGWQGSQF